MRTTLNIEDDLVVRASRLTGVKEKTSLVRMGLEALIALESAKRLAKLGGTEVDERQETPSGLSRSRNFILGYTPHYSWRDAQR